MEPRRFLARSSFSTISFDASLLRGTTLSTGRLHIGHVALLFAFTNATAQMAHKQE